MSDLMQHPVVSHDEWLAARKQLLAEEKEFTRLRAAKPVVAAIEDLDSANGTFVNGERIMERQVLCPGDRLRVGPVTFVVEYQMTQAAIDRLQDGVERQCSGGHNDAEPPNPECRANTADAEREEQDKQSSNENDHAGKLAQMD